MSSWPSIVRSSPGFRIVCSGIAADIEGHAALAGSTVIANRAASITTIANSQAKSGHLPSFRHYKAETFSLDAGAIYQRLAGSVGTPISLRYLKSVEPS